MKVNNLEITEVRHSRINLIYSVFLFLIVALSFKLRFVSLALSVFYVHSSSGYFSLTEKLAPLKKFRN